MGIIWILYEHFTNQSQYTTSGIAYTTSSDSDERLRGMLIGYCGGVLVGGMDGGLCVMWEETKEVCW